MVKVTYKPTDPTDTVTEVFGQVFEAGDSVDIKDEKQLEKLKGNPEFSISGAKDGDEGQGKERAKQAEKLSKIVDGRSKEAREARAKAEAADQDAAAKERAAAQAKGIAEARADKSEEG